MSIPAKHMPWQWLVEVVENDPRRKELWLVNVNGRSARVRASTVPKAVKSRFRHKLRGAVVKVERL